MDLFTFREPVNAWTHGAWMLVCIPAGILLQLRAGRSLLKHIGFAIYSLSLICCFFGSWLHHAVRLSPESNALCARLDFIGIFLLIAGTMTPIMLIALDGWWRVSCLTGTWLMALTGILLRSFNVPVPEEFSTGVYILMGWTGLISYCELTRRLSSRALRLIWIGGVLYTAGAILNEIQWPEGFWPRYLGAHELFHLFVMMASGCHFWFMMRVLGPLALPAPALESVEAVPSYALAAEQATA